MTTAGFSAVAVLMRWVAAVPQGHSTSKSLRSLPGVDIPEERV